MRRPLSYANVAATLALVFSMSGGALAATHYLIHSTKQISPKVLKALKGKTGKTGAPGKEGPRGKEGAAGKEGAPGQSALAPLPSGASESGSYELYAPTGGAGLEMKAAISFPVALATHIPSSHIVWTPNPSASNCPGAGSASAGYLCIYSAKHVDIEEPEFLNPESSSAKGETGLHGVLLEEETDTTPAYDYGTWTLTAP